MNDDLFDINSENQALLNTIRCYPNIEKTVLAKELDIAFKTAYKQIEVLQDKGFLMASEDLKVNPDIFYICGVSIGGSQCKLSLVDAEYRILSREKFERICENYNVFKQDFWCRQENDNPYCYRYFNTPEAKTDLMNYLSQIIRDVIRLRELSESNSDLPPIISVGMVFTGSVDAQKQEIIRSHNISYMNNVKKEDLLDMETWQKLKQSGIKFVIDHNAKAMVVCEKFSLYHADNENIEYKDKKNIACFYLGSGLGCGLILNNRLIRGSCNFSGELGHVQVARFPGAEEMIRIIEERCTCGAQHCLENYIIHDVFEMSRSEFRKKTSKEIGEYIENLTPEKYVQKMKILGYYIGWAVDAITKLLNVDLIIYSGKMTRFIAKASTYIVPPNGDLSYLSGSRILSKYATQAPAIGAAIMSTYQADELIEWLM